MKARPVAVMSAFARPRLYSREPLWYTVVSGEFRYFGAFAGALSPPSSRPPNPTAFPDTSWMGNMTRPRNRSRMAPAESCATRPASTKSSGEYVLLSRRSR